MTIVLKDVGQILAIEGLAYPELSALAPTIEHYNALLLQPKGSLQVTNGGVRNRTRDSAMKLFGGFLEKAAESTIGLAIAPEYSAPWSSVIECLERGVTPPAGGLWILGCESVLSADLVQVLDDLRRFGVVVGEPLVVADGRFIDPLVYVFHTKVLDGSSGTLVFLVQYKTHPMGGDPTQFETNHLQCGSWVFHFDGRSTNSISLLSLVCSDALSVNDDIDWRRAHDRTIIVHVQLNPDPRHHDFRRYRDVLMGFGNDSTEVIALNWARETELWIDDNSAESLGNVAGSAWYIKDRPQFKATDHRITANHQSGLYYTYGEATHHHALYLNYLPGLYEIRAAKLWHYGVRGVESYRVCPELLTRWLISDDGSLVPASEPADDGFGDACRQCEPLQEFLVRLASTDPLGVERLVALSTASLPLHTEWHSPTRLRTLAVEADEVVHRITFCQDPAPRGVENRTRQLKRLLILWDTLGTVALLPPSLRDLAIARELRWQPEYPMQNVLGGSGRRATVAYVGEDASDDALSTAHKTLASLLQQTSDADRDGDARQRLAIFYRNRTGDIASFVPASYFRFDRTPDRDELDIGRPE